MSRRYDQHTMQLMTMFEQMTGSKLRDCFNVDDLQVFVVEKGQIGRAVGRAGANVKKLAAALKSKIKIIEHSDDLAQFVANTVHPIKPARVEVDSENKIATIVPPDLLSRGLLIGRQAIKLRETEKIVQRFFDLTELKVSRPESGPQTVEEAEALKQQGAKAQETPSAATIGDVAGTSVLETEADAETIEPLAEAPEEVPTPVARASVEPAEEPTEPVETTAPAKPVAKPDAASPEAEAPPSAKTPAKREPIETPAEPNTGAEEPATVEPKAPEPAPKDEKPADKEPEASKKRPKTE